MEIPNAVEKVSDIMNSEQHQRREGSSCHKEDGLNNNLYEQWYKGRVGECEIKC